MDRRDLLGIIGGAATAALARPLTNDRAIALADAFHHQTGPPSLSPSERELIGALADTVLPRTDTPAATDAGVVDFIDKVASSWYDEPERRELTRGLAEIEWRCQDRFGRAFVSLDEGGRAKIVSGIDGKPGEPGSAEQAFSRVKSLTIYGYFTSERVQQNVLKKVIAPGRFSGCVPFGRP